VLIEHLPPESATMTALRNARPEDLKGGDSSKGCWSQAEMLLAALHDEVAHLAWITAVANSGKGPKPKKPDPIPRPGLKDTKRRRKTLSDEQYERLFAHINGLPGGPQLTLIKGGRNRGG
jgi:hypothetical protein